jgi:hypothetical protein
MASCVIRESQPSLRDSVSLVSSLPGDESPGYFRAPLRGDLTVSPRQRTYANSFEFNNTRHNSARPRVAASTSEGCTSRT